MNSRIVCCIVTIVFSLGITAESSAKGAFKTAGFERQIEIGMWAAQEEGLWNEALFRFLQAEKLRPGNAGVLNNIAVTAERTAKPEMAREYYEKALAASPDHPVVRENYKQFLEWYGRTDPETKNAKEIDTENPSGEGKNLGWERRRVQFALSRRGGTIIARNATVAILPFLATGEDSGIAGETGFEKYIGRNLKKERLVYTVLFPIGFDYPSGNIAKLVSDTVFWQSAREKVLANLFIVGSAECNAYEEGYRTEQYPFDGKEYERHILVEEAGFELDVIMFVVNGSNGTIVAANRVKKFHPFKPETEGQPEDRTLIAQNGFDKTAQELVKIFKPEIKPVTRYLLEP